MKDKNTRKVKNNHKKRQKTAEDFKRDLINHHKRMVSSMYERFRYGDYYSEHFVCY